jgi:nucleoid DNA-binding protein
MKKAGTVFKKPLDRSEIVAALAQATGLSKPQVAGVVKELAGLIQKNLEQAPGEFTVPGLFMLRVVRKPVTEVRTKIDPVTKAETVFKCDTVRHLIKLVPSKHLKDAVEYGWE